MNYEIKIQDGFIQIIDRHTKHGFGVIMSAYQITDSGEADTAVIRAMFLSLATEVGSKAFSQAKGLKQ